MPEARTFNINGEERTDQTFRTEIIEKLVGIKGRTFSDLGCADGFEAYVVGLRGAKYALGAEGRIDLVERGRLAARELGVSDRVEFETYDVRRIDEYNLQKFDVVMSFGLLYHLQNPFNHLKRVRNICGDDFLMETQIAPLTFEGVERDEVVHLSDLTTVILDGEPFEGRVMEYVTRSGTLGVGSLDKRLVFWMTVDSITRALDLAGFEVKQVVHNDPPAELEPWSSMLGHNQKRAKALFHARVRDPEAHIPAGPDTVKGLYSAPVSYPLMSGGRRLRRRMLHMLRWRWREL
jgi:hypothetical protein